MASSAFTVTGVNGITSVATGTGLSGGTITSTGTINLALTSLNGYRLTLTSNTPVTTADVTAATTLYCTPYKGIDIALYSGSAWLMFQPGQLSIAVPATTNHNYDVFMDYNGGTPQLALLVWTNQTTRATALAYQNGVYVLSGTATKRYLGTFATTGSSGQTEDSVANRFVWNYYNRVLRTMYTQDLSVTWSYNGGQTWGPLNGSTSDRFNIVVGVVEDGIAVQCMCTSQSSSYGGVGIGQNSTTANVAQSVGYTNTSGSVSTPVFFNGPPTLGIQYYQALQYGVSVTYTGGAGLANPAACINGVLPM